MGGLAFTMLLAVAGLAACRREIWWWASLVAPIAIVAAAQVAATRQRSFEQAAGIGVENSALYGFFGWVGFAVGLAIIGGGLLVRTRQNPDTTAKPALSIGVLLAIVVLGGGTIGVAHSVDDASDVAQAADCQAGLQVRNTKGPNIDRVLDGDTILMQDSDCNPLKLAMGGIDAPSSDQPCAAESTENAKAWVRRHPIVSRYASKNGPQRDDGVLYGQVNDEPGTPTLSEVQLSAGFARLDLKTGVPDTETTRRAFRAAEAAACNAHRGIWGRGCSRP